MSTEVSAVVMGTDEARKVTERIRLTLDSASQSLDRLAALVTDAYQRRADLALGYGSWQEYADAEFAEQTRDLSAPIRRELVGYLSASGMSTRAIAPTMGVSQQAAHKMVGRAREVTTPVVTSEPAPIDLATVDMTTGEIVEPATHVPAPSPTPVTGLDGKTYTRPAPAAPRRRPLADAARDAGQELRKAIERLERLAADDRFASNKEQVAAHLRGHLPTAIEVCQDLLNRINN